MHHSKVLDWRIWKAAEVAADGPPIEPGGSPVKKGDIVYVISTIDVPKTGRVNFVTPGPVPLALHIAIRAAKDADAARKKVVWSTEGPVGSPKWATQENLILLYAYFENSMVAATFAFQTLAGC
ncbi:MAG: hypothetical protein ACT4PJ_02980 [Gemmatimonadaceae bacterium]